MMAFLIVVLVAASLLQKKTATNNKPLQQCTAGNKVGKF